MTRLTVDDDPDGAGDGGGHGVVAGGASEERTGDGPADIREGEGGGDGGARRDLTQNNDSRVLFPTFL